MNANRTKYASTPTYGMQKRGFMKKAPGAGRLRRRLIFPRFRSPPPPCRPLRRRRSRPSRSPSPLRVGFQACRPISPPPCRARRRFPSRRPASFSPWRDSRLFRALHRAHRTVPPLGNTAFGSSSAAFSPRSQGFVPPSPMTSQPPAASAQAVRPGQSQPIRPTVQPAMYAFSPMQSGAPERRRRPCPVTPLRGE